MEGFVWWVWRFLVHTFFSRQTLNAFQGVKLDISLLLCGFANWMDCRSCPLNLMVLQKPVCLSLFLWAPVCQDLDLINSEVAVLLVRCMALFPCDPRYVELYYAYLKKSFCSLSVWCAKVVRRYLIRVQHHINLCMRALLHPCLACFTIFKKDCVLTVSWPADKRCNIPRFDTLTENCLHEV